MTRQEAPALLMLNATSLFLLRQQRDELLAVVKELWPYAEQVRSEHVRSLGTTWRNIRYQDAIQGDIDRARAAIAWAEGQAQ